MTSSFRLPDYLEHMRQAANDACSFVDGLTKEDFLEDKRTQQATAMSLVIIGELTAKVMDGFPEFTKKHPEIQWHGMRGLRNRIAHGYFDVDFNIVWDTVQIFLPELLQSLPPAIEDAQSAQ